MSESLSPSSSYHRVFGLVVRSVLPLPELLPAARDAVVDVEIDFGDVPETLPGARERNVVFDVAGEQMLIRMRGLARFLLRAGRAVTIAPAPNVSVDDVRATLLTFVLGALLHQRDELVLHGSAVGVRGFAVGFLGFSGMGKSTTAAGFHRRGYPVLTDDLCVVRPMPNGGWAIHPGFPHMKLWLDALEKLELSAEGLRRIVHKEQKRALPIAAGFAPEALPVKKFYLLRSSENDALSLRPLEGAAKLAALRNQTYRRRMLAGMEKRSRHFQQALELARDVPVTIATRPERVFRLDEFIDLLEADLAG